MLEHSIYSVISPEGCASILWRNTEFSKEAAKTLKLTSNDCKNFKIIDDIIPEPYGGAHRHPTKQAEILKEKIKPDDLSGSIVMIPVMNVPAMEAAERGNPLDTFSYDMNRIYPGRKEGYLSERIAHIHKEWMIKYADMEISSHSGGSHSYLAEAMFAAKDDKTQELARAMGEDWKVCLYSNITSKSPMAVMAENGKPALTVELGGRSSTAPGAFLRVGQTLLKACINILTHYKMIEGTPHYPEIRYKGFQQALLAPKSGVLLPNPNVKFLTMMKKNDEIAKIIDYQGKELCILKAPEDGMFFGLRALPNVTIGDWCCFYAIIEGEW